MSESTKKYENKENYIVPMTVAQKGGHLHAVILKEMAPNHIKGKRVVHVGCNAATTTYHVKPLEPSYLAGVDVNAEAIEAAKKTLPSADFFHASAHDLPFKNASFDTVILFAVFEHLYEEDKIPAAKELKRILKPGGCVLVQLPKATPGSRDEKMKQNAYDPHHVSFYFKEEDVHKDFPGFSCLKIWHETRRNPNNNAAHSSWVGIYRRK